MPLLLNHIHSLKAKHFDILPQSACLEKTRKIFRNGSFVIEKGCDIYTHLWTTCMILRILKKIWKDYPRAKEILPEAEWLAAFHDIGKVTPAFLCKLYKALGEKSPWAQEIEEIEGGHARSSEIILEKEYGRTFAHLAGCHHGGASWTLGGGDNIDAERLGGCEWQSMRIKLLTQLKENLQLPNVDLKDIPQFNRSIIVGAVILADWLSSSMDLPFGEELPSEMALKEVISQAGLLPADWQKKLTFHDLFGFKQNFLQQACDELAKPGSIYVIESGMGSGKTEAALFLAYQLLSQNKANGLYFAMPTRLTSEKIYERLNQFLDKGVTEDNMRQSLLIHGEAWLNWMIRQPDENGDCDDMAGSWFQTKKRALLAPFAAGTVDQALMAVINVRHRDLRAFALAGKVVILDEVHSYDAYTGTLIATLVKDIRAWGGTVIILSATLTREIRAQLLGIPLTELPHQSAYPLISAMTEEGFREISLDNPENSKNLLLHTTEFTQALNEAVEHALNGEQVLWIVNTVATAQDVYRKLTISVPTSIELGLIHSRFPACIRRKQEDYWVSLLGKNGKEERIKTGRILVATQVLEQSVDVDADFLITQLAPGDMIFQRIGRLWRHPVLDSIRPDSAKRQCMILSPEEIADSGKWLQSKSKAQPYDPYWLLRTWEQWHELTAVSVPQDIRPTLEAIYADREETDASWKLKDEMLEKKKKLQRLAAISESEANQLKSDETVSTRYDESEEVQVLLLKKGNRGYDLKQCLACFFTNSPIEIPSFHATHKQKNEATAKLLETMIKIRHSDAPSYEDFKLDFLKHLLWVGEKENRPIRAAYVEESGQLLTMSGLPVEIQGQHGTKTLYYHEKLGYVVHKKEF